MNDQLLLRPPSLGPELSSERIGQLALQPHSQYKKMTDRGDGVTIYLTARSPGMRLCGLLTLHKMLALIGNRYCGSLLNTATGYNIEMRLSA